jgi:hypothetical protein
MSRPPNSSGPRLMEVGVVLWTCSFFKIACTTRDWTFPSASSSVAIAASPYRMDGIYVVRWKIRTSLAVKRGDKSRDANVLALLLRKRSWSPKSPFGLRSTPSMRCDSSSFICFMGNNVSVLVPWCNCMVGSWGRIDLSSGRLSPILSEECCTMSILTS